MSAAAAVWRLARGCALGNLAACSCATPPRKEPPSPSALISSSSLATATMSFGGLTGRNTFKWGGCGDDVRSASRMAKRFLQGATPPGTGPTAKFLHAVNMHNNRAGRRVSRIERLTVYIHWYISTHTFIVSFIFLFFFSRFSFLCEQPIHPTTTSKQAVEQSLTLECKCHGVSGSCSVRTCWRGLGSSGPSVAGTRLLRRYATAAEVKPRSGGRLPPLYHHDNLLYTTKSPDYCLPDKKRGSLGTIGR